MSETERGGSGAGSTVETSEAMPTGVIHDLGCRCWPHIEASAVTQLRADLEAARKIAYLLVRHQRRVRGELQQG